MKKKERKKRKEKREGGGKGRKRKCQRSFSWRDSSAPVQVNIAGRRRSLHAWASEDVTLIYIMLLPVHGLESTADAEPAVRVFGGGGGGGGEQLNGHRFDRRQFGQHK